MVTSSPVRYGKTALFALALLVLVATSLAQAPVARAWLGFTTSYGNRTATSVTVSWTVRGQEDAPSTAADVARVCWRAGDAYSPYACDSHQVTLSQYGSVGSTNSYTINGLTCANSYRVIVAQPYVLAVSWDWDEQSIVVGASCPQV